MDLSCTGLLVTQYTCWRIVDETPGDRRRNNLVLALKIRLLLVRVALAHRDATGIVIPGGGWRMRLRQMKGGGGRRIARFGVGGRRRSRRGRGGEDEGEEGVASRQDAMVGVDEGIGSVVYAESNVHESVKATVQKGEVI